MKLQILCMSMIGLVLTSVCVAEDQTKETERVAVKSLDDINWLVGTAEGSDKVHEDMSGIGKKGDEFQLRVTTTPVLNGTFYMGVGRGTKDGQTHEMFREVWGMDPSSGSLYRWFYDRNGAVLEGKVYKQGEDRMVHVVEGSLIPKDGPLKQLAETMKVTELNYYGEIVFRRVPEKKLGVTVQAVKIGGVAFPWPNLDKEMIYQIVE